MSRFALVCSLVFGLSSSSLVSTADASFAKPPPAAAAVSSNVVNGDAVAMPQRWLDRDAVRSALVKARATNLAAFRAYQAKGVFPSNTFTKGKLNVWLDRDGNFCAAATIIKMSGKDDLVNTVAADNNFIRLADVKQGPLMDWILTSGFTQDEIAAIQEPFIGVDDEPSMRRERPILAKVNPQKRKVEDARLRTKYKAVDKMIVKNANKSLDKAVDRLMKNPQLAFQLIDAQS